MAYTLICLPHPSWRGWQGRTWQWCRKSLPSPRLVACDPRAGSTVLRPPPVATNHAEKSATTSRLSQIRSLRLAAQSCTPLSHSKASRPVLAVECLYSAIRGSRPSTDTPYPLSDLILLLCTIILPWAKQKDHRLALPEVGLCHLYSVSSTQVLNIAFFTETGWAKKCCTLKTALVHKVLYLIWGMGKKNKPNQTKHFNPTEAVPLPFAELPKSRKLHLDTRYHHIMLWKTPTATKTWRKPTWKRLLWICLAYCRSSLVLQPLSKSYYSIPAKLTSKATHHTFYAQI